MEEAAMKTILVPYHDEEAGRSALATAIHIARRFGSYVEGMIVLGTPPLTLAPGMALSPDYLAVLAKEWRSFAATARDHFLGVADENGLPYRESVSAGDGPAVGWREMDGKEPDVVGRYGRSFDLIVLGRTSATGVGRWRETCEAALFDSGRPVLLASATVPEHVGRAILVAWNGSTESARTIGLAMPLLAAADRVDVVSVKGSGVPGPSAGEVAEHLARHGVPVASREIDALGRPAGEALLDEASDMGADLVLKGAFTHSRLRQVIFGGTTQHILEYSLIPALLAH
jgi:nucleotide-binding universal stress UspA family protein